jgi:hypothetical protein
MTQLSERLADLRLEMSETKEAMHIAAIQRELMLPPRPAPVPRRSRKRLAVVLVSAMVLVLPAAAIASEDSVPGDLLYPVKRSAEWGWSFVDSEVAARHRVEELEIVLVRGDPPEDVRARLSDAEAAASDASPALVRRLEQAREQIRVRYGATDQGRGGTDSRGQDGAEGSEADSLTVTTSSPDDPGVGTGDIEGDQPDQERDRLRGEG